MKKMMFYLLKYIMPCLIICIYFIPFICIRGNKENNLIYYDIYLSPFKCLIEMNKYFVLSVTFLIINMSYLIFCFIKDDNRSLMFRKLTLALSIILYIFIFKFTTNSNLNLLSVIINLIIVLIYICNCLKEIFYNEFGFMMTSQN